MKNRTRVALFGWREDARCLLDAWQSEAMDVEVVGALAPPTEARLPAHVPALRRLASPADLKGEGGVTYLLDLRPPGSPRPDDLPANVAWVPAAAVQLLMRHCQPLLESNRFRGVLETAVDAVVTIDESHTILFFNQAAESMFGFTRAEAIGEDLSMIIPPPHRERHREYVRRYVQTRKGRFINHTVELTARRRSGEDFPISISFSVAEEGDHLLMTAVMRDTSRVKALERRALQNERLVSIGQALSYVTHEIKNPLMVIGGFARSLQQCDDIAGEDRDRLDIIVKEVQRLEGLLAEIQDFTKPLQLERQEMHLGPFVQEVLALFGGSEASQNVSFSMDIDGDPVVSADPDRLRQVLLNLVKNAIEAIPEKGRIEVRAWGGRRTAHLEIRDTGEGIPPEKLEEIFEPFVTTKKGGSGLGLPLSRKIVQDHGGELRVFSKPGEGTRVRIDLPSARH